MDFLGIHWVGITSENGRKLLLSLAVITVVVLGAKFIRYILGVVLHRTDEATVKSRFWLRQSVSLAGSICIVLAMASIWFTDPTRLTTAFGLMSAGLAFALQQVITSFAGYFVILRGSTFSVGDRISMGGVRGDVMRLGFIQTTIMEMGQPPSVQSAEPAVWVKSRQFTGRIVTVTNSKIFAEPVYNYTRDFPYIWEEMAIPITYETDSARVEEILLASTVDRAVDPSFLAADAKEKLQAQFGITPIDLQPHVYFRITDNWLELTLRFLVHAHRIRDVKDGMSRFIVREFEEAGIGIASATYDIVGFPKLELANATQLQPVVSDARVARKHPGE